MGNRAGGPRLARATQWLRVHITLAENLRSVLSTHVGLLWRICSLLNSTSTTLKCHKKNFKKELHKTKKDTLARTPIFYQVSTKLLHTFSYLILTADQSWIVWACLQVLLQDWGRKMMSFRLAWALCTWAVFSYRRKSFLAISSQLRNVKLE